MSVLLRRVEGWVIDSYKPRIVGSRRRLVIRTLTGAVQIICRPKCSLLKAPIIPRKLRRTVWIRRYVREIALYLRPKPREKANLSPLLVHKQYLSLYKKTSNHKLKDLLRHEIIRFGARPPVEVLQSFGFTLQDFP